MKKPFEYKFNNIIDYKKINLDKDYYKEFKLTEAEKKIFKNQLFNLEDILKFESILISKDIIKSINDNIDFLLNFIPELRDMIDFPHNHPHHHLDVWNHTLLALSLSENYFEIRLSLLFHDIGKPHCYQDKEVRHFKGHAIVSSKIAKSILSRMFYDYNSINEICYLIEKHDTEITHDEIVANYELEYKRFQIQYADTFAHHPDKISKRKKYLNYTNGLFNEVKNNKQYKK